MQNHLQRAPNFKACRFNPTLQQHIANCKWDFPNVLHATFTQTDCIATGADLKPDTILKAYNLGLFPWFDEYPIEWWSPNPRCVFFSNQFIPSKSLIRQSKKLNYSIGVNQQFTAVITACQQLRQNTGTWISDDVIRAYTTLHHLGYAHSIEISLDGQLIGGLYGLKLGQCFFGESMFHTKTDASKIAFWFLNSLCQASHISLIDAQVENPHLLSLGANLIPRQQFIHHISHFILEKSANWHKINQLHLPCAVLNDKTGLQTLLYNALV